MDSRSVEKALKFLKHPSGDIKTVAIMPIEKKL